MISPSTATTAPVDEDLAEQARPGYGIPSQDPRTGAQTALEPEDAEREAHSALMGGGMMAGAAAGAAVGGVVGHQIGKGNGRKVATALGVLGGAVVGAGAAGTEKMVPYTLVSFRDNQTGQMYEAAIDGPWRPGMAIRYSITEDGKLVLR